MRITRLRSWTLTLSLSLAVVSGGGGPLVDLAPRGITAEPVAEAAPSPGRQALRGMVAFRPSGDEATVPEMFRLAEHSFAFEQKPLDDVSRVLNLWEVTFPSPVVTPQPNNNTVHCEYFQPVAPGKHPGVIVLHILGGDFPLSRLFARSLAHAGVAALFVKMPYYGPRRQPDSPARMVSIDPEETRRGMKQAVLDVRQATAWLGSRPEVDEARLGVMGISLGGITSALAATAEPRLENVCLILAGGGIGEVAWEAKELRRMRETWTAGGGTKESLVKLFQSIDPVAYAANVRGRRILMLNADRDEVIPRSCTEALWRAFGEPEIVWWPAGHYSAALFLTQGVSRATKFFAASRARGE